MGSTGFADAVRMASVSFLATLKMDVPFNQKGVTGRRGGAGSAIKASFLDMSVEKPIRQRHVGYVA